MNIEVTKQDLIALVKGSSPYYSLFDDPIVKKCGSFTAGFVDKWDWNGNLKTLTEEQLFDLYVKCKESWK